MATSHGEPPLQRTCTSRKYAHYVRTTPYPCPLDCHLVVSPDGTPLDLFVLQPRNFGYPAPLVVHNLTILGPLPMKPRYTVGPPLPMSRNNPQSPHSYARPPRAEVLGPVFDGKFTWKAFLHIFVRLSHIQQWTEGEQHDQFYLFLEGSASE